mmetsp:Transcript_119502/g.168091  ORF Transcript_119502/g.168091 Transcript_119502/m.168091 type:complete len:90 (+) Transcript_119502:68-337(+)
MSVTGARVATTVSYVQSGQQAKSGDLTVTRSESLDGAYLIGAQRRSNTMLSMVSPEDRKSSSDDFEDDENDRPGPNFKIGCRRKALALI